MNRLDLAPLLVTEFYSLASGSICLQLLSGCSAYERLQSSVIAPFGAQLWSFSEISFLILAIAWPGLRCFGHTLVQFMIV